MLHYKKSKAYTVFTIFNYIMLSLLAFVAIYPFIYFLVLSFNDGFDAMKGGIYFWPRVFTLDNYIKAFEDSRIIDSYVITIFRTTVGTFISVLFSALLAYGLSFKELPGKKLLVFLFFFTTLFTGGLVPMYILLRDLKLTTSVWIYVIPFVYNFYNVIILRTFFQTIPVSLSESARIDGASELMIFFKLIIPLSKPVLATIALFYGVQYWNDWFTGTFFVSDKSMIPTSTLLQQLLQEASFDISASNGMNMNPTATVAQSATTPESLRMTFVIITTVPIICVYPFLQKYFTKGIMLGSVKG